MSRRLAFLALFAALIAAPALADYVTPGTGVQWTLDDLVAASGGAVTGSEGQYTVHASVTVSLTDRLELQHSQTLVFADTSGEVQLDIHGSLIGRQARLTSATAQPGDWYGVRFRDTDAGSVLDLEGCTLEYGRYGVDVVYADIRLVSCRIRHTLEKAVDLTGSGGEVVGCLLTDNRAQTIYMTLGSSPLIDHCTLERNNLDNNSPYPYISVGLQGVNSPTIRDCLIIGGQTKSGGIAIWNLSQALIQGNTIRGCGYGILCYSVGANPTIVGNRLVANTLNPDTVNWGFGIACNGDNQPVIENNFIREHWYGIAITGGAQPDLGHAEPLEGQSGGWNVMIDNGLGDEVYAIFNNTSNPISAENNIYAPPGEVLTLEDVENRIWHQVDDLSLGPVDFDPSILEYAITHAESTPALLTLHGAYPNPFNPQTRIAFTLGQATGVEVRILDARGRCVRRVDAGHMQAGRREVSWDGTGDDGRFLPSGLYLYRIKAGDQQAQGRMQLVR
jgi:parallel beta-helix repeat protein